MSYSHPGEHCQLTPNLAVRLSTQKEQNKVIYAVEMARRAGAVHGAFPEKEEKNCADPESFPLNLILKETFSEIIINSFLLGKRLLCRRLCLINQHYHVWCMHISTVTDMTDFHVCDVNYNSLKKNSG